MPFVYILKTAQGTKYTGSTINLLRRIEEHMGGLVKSTKGKRPLILYATRECETMKEAAFWEKKYKKSLSEIERHIKKGILKLV
ncbi:MAG: GIY-YIG nuclease family protein [bacterium]|nr:GIY-YIG nuclease family protein [bacterium]